MTHNKLLFAILSIFFFFIHYSVMSQQTWQYYDSVRTSYEEKQTYDSALVYGEKALQLVKDTTGENDTLYTTMLETMFYLNYYKGNYKKALEYCEKERNIRRTIQGVRHPDYAEALNNLAALYYFMGEYIKAKPLFIESIDIRKATFGERHPDYAQSLNNLALLYHYMGEYSAAEQLFIVAGNIWKETLGEKHPTYGLLLNNLALLYKETGDYSKAEPMLIEALKIRKETAGENSSDYAQSLNGLAAVYDDMGNYVMAEALYIQSKDTYKNVVGEKHPYYANSLNNLSLLYQKMGMYTKSEPLNIEAIRLKEESIGKKHPSYAQSIHNLAMLYYKTGNSVLSSGERKEAFAKSESLYIEAIQIDKEFLGEKHQSYAVDLNNLASLYKDMGNYSKAEPLFIEAKNIWKNSLGEKHHLYASSLSNLAGLYNLMSHSATDQNQAMVMNSKATPLYLEAIDICYSNIWQNFSFMSEKEKEMYFKTKAEIFEGFYSFSLERKIENAEITKNVFNNIVKNKGLLLKSSTAMRAAIYNSNDTSLISQYKSWIDLSKEISKLYSTEISKRKKNPEELEQRANVIEKDLVKGSQVFSDFEKLQNLTWESVKNSLKPGEAAVEFLRFKSKSSNKDTVISKEKRPKQSALKEEIASSREIGTRKDDIIVYCALLITPQSKQPEMIKLFEEKQILEILNSASGNNLNQVNNSYGTNANTKDSLYKLIWQPMEKYLEGVKTIYYSPDGILHKVSFAALGKSKNMYLCDNINLQQVSSTGKVAMPENTLVDKDLTACIIGGVDYSADSSASSLWQYLPGTLTEANAIKTKLSKNKIKVTNFSGKEATELSFKNIYGNEGTQPEILHIATHGFFYPDPEQIANEQKKVKVEEGLVAFRGSNSGFGLWQFVKNKNPLMRSGVVLAGANKVWSEPYAGTDNEGVLTAQEVTQLDMTKTKLVVLSACETGLGDIKGSEGVYGLQRAFKMAGVKFIIMSLWEVPDKETMEFMEMFYTKLLKTKDIRLAFTETQKEMRQKYDPYYWGAFVLVE